jgi:hypothetical protein
MHHFMREDKAAPDNLRAAAGLTFKDSKMSDEKSKKHDVYLGSLIKEYIPAIESGKSLRAISGDRLAEPVKSLTELSSTSRADRTEWPSRF